MCAEQVGSVLLLDKVKDSLTGSDWKNDVIQSPARDYLRDKVPTSMRSDREGSHLSCYDIRSRFHFH